MTRESPYDVVVIGAGASGLTIAIGAAKLGKRVFLAEKNRYGGDCTNFGCIPSKALIASAHCAHAIRTASELGIDLPPVTINAAGALKRVREIVKKVRKSEEPKVLEELGIETMLGAARFLDPHTLTIGNQNHAVRGKKIVIATGSHPFAPPIPGLETIPYLTNETIFDLKTFPKSLLCIGGGPIGCELAQAFARLGSEVAIISRKPYLLAREESAAQEVLAEAFCKEGITLYLNFQPRKVEKSGKGVLLLLEKGKEEKSVFAERLFIATGRRPNCHGLDLDRAHITWSKQGIATDSYGRTSQRHIYAVGDVTGEPFFTHRAENQARTTLRNLFFPIRKKQSTQPIPRCTYTDPEIASIGMSEQEAIDQFKARRIACYSVPFTEVDRSITSGRTEGFVKLITKKWSSQLLGATIVGPRAGEMLMQISTAIEAHFPLRKFLNLIHPYPTESVAIRKGADLWIKETILPALFKLIGKR